MQNNNNNNKQTNKQKIEKWQHCKKWQKWPFGRPLVRQNGEKWWKIAHFGTAIQISKNTRNTNLITAKNKYVWTVETFFKYFAKKAPSCEKRVKLPFFKFSRRSCGLVVGNLLLLKNENPQYIICIKRAKWAHYLWTSLTYAKSGAGSSRCCGLVFLSRKCGRLGVMFPKRIVVYEVS